MEVDNSKKNDSKPPSDDLAQIHADVQARVDALQQELSDIRKLERLLAQLVEYRDRSWLLHLKSACERESNLLKELRKQDHPAIPVVEALFRDAHSKASGVIQSIPAELERLSKVRGITLDFARSRHPKYLFAEDGFIEVIVNDKKQCAYIATREGKLTNLPADPEAIIDTVATEDKRLFGRRFNGKRFLHDLRAAYLVALKKQKAQDGYPVPIREVFDCMSGRTKAYKNYKRDEFLVDLSYLTKHGPAETDGFRFELQQTKDTTEGMLLLGAAGQGMVNLLIFRK